MSKVKARMIKKKMKSGSGVDLAGMMDMMFTNTSKSLGIEVIKTRYMKYKEDISIYLVELRSISELMKVYEPGAEIVYRSFVDNFNRFFAYTNENPSNSEEENAFFENYDEFKKSQLLLYCIRLAGRISKSGINQQWKTIQNKARKGLLKLDIFNNVIDNVSAPYDISNYYHTSARTTPEEQETMTNSLKAIVNAGKGIYQSMKQPDIPLDRLFESFRDSLLEYKHKVRGVNKLFDVITKNSGLFEGNFSKYYKNMIKGGNPYSIFTDFLTDVAGDPGVRDPSLVKECAILIRHLKQSVGSIPPEYAKEAKKMTSIMDSIIDVIGDNSELDASLEFSEDDIKKMINELESKFNPK